jgi:hypothetical protein
LFVGFFLHGAAHAPWPAQPEAAGMLRRSRATSRVLAGPARPDDRLGKWPDGAADRSTDPRGLSWSAATLLPT